MPWLFWTEPMKCPSEVPSWGNYIACSTETRYLVQASLYTPALHTTGYFWDAKSLLRIKKVYFGGTGVGPTVVFPDNRYSFENLCQLVICEHLKRNGPCQWNRDKPRCINLKILEQESSRLENENTRTLQTKETWKHHREKSLLDKPSVKTLQKVYMNHPFIKWKLSL